MPYNENFKKMTDEELDTFLATLDPEFETLALKAQAKYDELYKVPVPRFVHLKALAGGIMLAGSLAYVFHWLMVLKAVLFP